MGGDQLFALLMHDLDDRTAAQQILVPGVLADVGVALPRGLVAHLITHRIAEIPGDGELVGCVPRGGRRDLDRAIAVVANPGPLDGDLAEGGLEGVRSCPAALDPVAPLAVPTLEDQLLIRLLHKELEEPALDFEPGVMDERLDLVGEMLVLVGQGQAHLEPEFERKRLTLAVDGSEGEGSLKVAGVTHGESPYWSHGDSSCVFSPIRLSKSFPPAQVVLVRPFPVLCKLS